MANELGSFEKSVINTEDNAIVRIGCRYYHSSVFKISSNSKSEIVKYNKQSGNIIFNVNEFEIVRHSQEIP